MRSRPRQRPAPPERFERMVQVSRCANGVAPPAHASLLATPCLSSRVRGAAVRRLAPPGSSVLLSARACRVTRAAAI
jgi:hypothetical protein